LEDKGNFSRFPNNMQSKTRGCTRAEIDLSALDHNLEQIRKRVGRGCKILAVVKADAYGHGACLVSRELLSAGADMLGVATAAEGIRLRQAGIEAPILLLLGMLDRSPEEIIQADLTPVISESTGIQALADAARRAGRRVKVHVKLDTGMGRLGFPWEQGVEVIQRLMHLQGIEVEGLLTHFAQAEAPDKAFTQLQLSRFEEVIAELNRQGIEIPVLHAANSAAIIDFSPSYLNMVRPGIMLYGAVPDSGLQPKIDLKPVMSVKTKIIRLRKMPAGCSLSYGRTYITPKESTIATIPIGYAAGYSRALSNRGRVLIGGVRAPIVGRVCMDMSLVDVTHLPEVKLGDEVLVWGKDDAGTLPVEDIADLADTIAYELLCLVGRYLPRRYYRQEELVDERLAAYSR
jgi:alanine racemase